jgi:hypothetical protein
METLKILYAARLQDEKIKAKMSLCLIKYMP